MRYSTSFFLSLLFHLLLVVGVNGVYRWSEVQPYSVPQEQTVRTLCLKTVTIQAPHPPKKAPQPPRQKIKKSKKMHTQKKVQKKVVVRKSIPQLYKPPKQKEHPMREMAATKIQESNCTHITPPTVVKHKEVQPTYTQLHLQEIATLISNNIYYPRRARKKHIEGRVVLRFDIDTSGHVKHIEVVESHKKILSHAAVQTIEELDGSFPHPDDEVTITIPLEFKLQN